MSDRVPSKQTLLLCGTAAVVAAAALWLVWPRRPKASHEALLLSLRRLREEYSYVYADVGASVESSGARKHLEAASFSSFASVASPEEEDGGTQKLKQVLEQPLILEAALCEANATAASELFPGATSEDLEAELQRSGEEDEEVRRSMEDITEMHQACLLGERAAASKAQTITARDAWSEDEALEMLRRLGLAKVAKLEALKLRLSREESACAIPGLGAKAIEDCVNAEDDVWQQSCGADLDLASRRCLFGLALQSYSEDHLFSKRRAAIQRELESATVAVGRGLVSRLSVA